MPRDDSEQPSIHHLTRHNAETAVLGVSRCLARVWPSGSQNGSRVAACCLVSGHGTRGRCRWRPYQAYACGASPGPGQIRSSRSTTSASNCTVSAPRSDCSSSIVVAPTIVVETTRLRSSQASATSAGFRPNSRAALHRLRAGCSAPRCAAASTHRRCLPRWRGYAVGGGRPTVVRAESHRLVHLPRQHDVVAVPAALQPPAHRLLRDAVPLCRSADLAALPA
jgi:hypothetical protein